MVKQAVHCALQACPSFPRQSLEFQTRKLLYRWGTWTAAYIYVYRSEEIRHWHSSHDGTTAWFVLHVWHSFTMMQTVLLPTASDDATQYVMPIPELVIYNRGAHKSVIASPSFVVQPASHFLLYKTIKWICSSMYIVAHAVCFKNENLCLYLAKTRDSPKMRRIRGGPPLTKDLPYTLERYTYMSFR